MNQSYKILSALFCLIICSCIQLSAQHTLTRANAIPQSGDSVHYIITTQPAFHIPREGGTQVWDFSPLSGTPATVTYFDLNQSQDSASFPMSSLVENDLSGLENYFSVSNNEILIDGSFSKGLARTTFNNQRLYLKFPMSLGVSYTDTFSGNHDILSSQVNFDRSGHTQVSGHAVGTIILPYGQLNDVLQVLIVSEYSDRLLGATITEYQDSVYFWYSPYANTYIASYSVFYKDGAKSGSFASYILQDHLISASASDNTRPNEAITLFPNPADQSTTIRSEQPLEWIRVSDASGRICPVQTSLKEKSIDVSKLPDGVYFIQVYMGGKHYNRRLYVR